MLRFWLESVQNDELFNNTSDLISVKISLQNVMLFYILLKMIGELPCFHLEQTTAFIFVMQCEHNLTGVKYWEIFLLSSG